MRKILLAAGVAVSMLLATPAASIASPKPAYKCTTAYSHRNFPVSGRSQSPGKPVTEEQLNCTPVFTGKLVVRVTGGREKTVTGAWPIGPIEGKVPFTRSGALPAGVEGSPAVLVSVPGTVPFSYLPKISIS
jgi:hypothetical protein